MEIYLATDHAGFELKEIIKDSLNKSGLKVVDFGAYKYNPNDHYPDFIKKAAEAVSRDPENSRGIIFGGSGQGEAIVANKHKGVRAAIFLGLPSPIGVIDIKGKTSEDPFIAIRQSRNHNNANVLSVGARYVTPEQAIEGINIWLNEPFSDDLRHVTRINMVSVLEKRLHR